MLRSSSTLVASGVATLFLPMMTEGETWVVHADGTGDYPTIQTAVDVAQDGDVILLSSGVFRGDGNINIDFGGKPITVKSESGDPTQCVIDCEATSTFPQRIGFFLQSWEGRDSIIEGITVRNGGYDLGGGIFLYRASPSIVNCHIVNNQAEEGGGLLGSLSSPLVEGCLISGNTASSFPGGGLYFTRECHPVFRHTTITANSSGVDAGGNREGGGLALRRQSFALLDNCIISGNLRGEAIHCDETSVAQIRCSNVFGNEGGDWVGCIASQQNLTGNISLPPLFCDPLAGNFHLSENSPCAPASSGCGLMGALDVQCGVIGIAPLGWGRVKSLYR